MERFKKELYAGLIHFRDRHQFELKSEFRQVPGLDSIDYTQEFYLFIPNALQINRRTYSREQFYRDQTNLVRYKTPEFELRALIDPSQTRSPLQRLAALRNRPDTTETREAIKDEVKLLGNIIRSAIRKRVRLLVQRLEAENVKAEAAKTNDQILALVREIADVQGAFAETKRQYLEIWEDRELRQHFSHVDEFICRSVDYHLTGLLKFIRHVHLIPLRRGDKAVEDLILLQNPYQPHKTRSDQDETFGYRRGLLNKFVLDALLLSIKRLRIIDTYQNIINMTAAAIAMLFFLIGIVWQGNIFIVNSTPFIVISVFLYVIKDRMKDGIKALYHEKASRWFPDFKIEIRTPSDRHRVGTLQEAFSFIPPTRLPKDINNVRNREFHNVLETFKRPEKVMYYKSEVELTTSLAKLGARRYDLNTIFRLNIHRFLEKASDTHTPYTTLDKETHRLKEVLLPKVYHINIIVRNSYTGPDKEVHTELRKFRLVINKDGILRIEQNFPQR